MVPALIVYPRYFATMGIPVVKGRDFNEDDLRPGSPFAVLVNEAFVREYIREREPLGVNHGVMQTQGRSSTPMGPLPIIGVVRDSRFPNLREATPPTVYQTFLQANTGFAQMVLHVRTARDTGEIARYVREAVQAVDKDVPIFDVHTLADEVNAALVRERLLATLSSAFGLVALALICIGLYGLMAFTVARRTSEIGVRMALGATPESVLRLVIGDAFRLVAIGVVVGVLAALALTQVLRALLFDTDARDPWTLAVTAIVLTLVALGAASVPARRGTRITPVQALRVR
jgi:ABC-type antimicrobial peptide transport system permease subunit